MPISVTCSSCGTMVPAGDRFCGTCGNPITGSAVLSDPSRFDPWAELLQRLRQATIGEYEIRGELGRGGMAAVFLAHDLQLNRKVAVKVMLPGLVYGDRMWDRFLAEARTAAKLDHPNIVYIHSVKEKDRFLYFVMKYIDGRALDDLVAQHKQLPIPVTQTILVEVARALDYAHKEGVVHRDIKPANIMIDQKGNAIVMDFGIARAADSQHFTQTGATIGTPAYMSPEQCHGRDTTAASDQYSLGVLAYELLAGSPPFSGSPIELQLAHMQDVPVHLRDLRPDLSLELSGAVMRMLEKDAAARWPSLHHLVPIFGRGLEAHDEAPRNHLISLVRAGTPRHHSFPATPVSPPPGTTRNTPFEARTPVSDFHVRPSAATTPLPVAGTRAHLDATQRAAAEAAAGAATADHVVASGPHDTPTMVSGPQALVPMGGMADSFSVVSAREPDDTDIARPVGKSLRRMTPIAAGVVVAAALGFVMTRDKPAKPQPVVPPPVVADSAPAVPVSAASAIESALGDSVMVGAGSDALVKVRGKLPRTVAGEAISLLEVTIAKPSIAVGDTVHAKVEAFDDAGQRVTTPQMVWTSSNPRVARFLAPGDLIAGQEGSATITVTAGPTSVTKEFVVGPKVPRRGAAGPKGTRRAEKS